jgi:hypothetical protein
MHQDGRMEHGVSSRKTPSIDEADGASRDMLRTAFLRVNFLKISV